MQHIYLAQHGFPFEKIIGAYSTMIAVAQVYFTSNKPKNLSDFSKNSSLLTGNLS